MNQELSSHAHCVFYILYHIVFVTKYRRKALSEVMLKRLEDIFCHLLENAGCRLVEFGGEADHVHLLIEAHPNIKPSRLVNTLKTISSRMLRKEFAEDLTKVYWKPALWHRAYCLISAGGALLDVLKRYIENQGKDG